MLLFCSSSVISLKVQIGLSDIDVLHILRRTVLGGLSFISKLERLCYQNEVKNRNFFLAEFVFLKLNNVFR